jgi:hypothetical protein
MKLETSKPAGENIWTDLGFQTRTHPLEKCVMPHVAFFSRLRLIASGLKSLRCRRQIHLHVAAFQFHSPMPSSLPASSLLPACHGRL